MTLPNKFTTPLKKPCFNCPYRKGTPETLETLYMQIEWFSDGEIQHGCHNLNNYNKEEDSQLGCLGSKLFAEKLAGADHPEIKELVEIL